MSLQKLSSPRKPKATASIKKNRLNKSRAIKAQSAGIQKINNKLNSKPNDLIKVKKTVWMTKEGKPRKKGTLPPNQKLTSFSLPVDVHKKFRAKILKSKLTIRSFFLAVVLKFLK